MVQTGTVLSSCTDQTPNDIDTEDSGDHSINGNDSGDDECDNGMNGNGDKTFEMEN